MRKFNIFIDMLRPFLLLFIFRFILNLNSSVVEEFPYWILLEKGRQLIYSKEGFVKSNLTIAMNYLQEALLRKGIYPEANYYLSVAYSMIGNVVLEKLHLQKALENKDYLLDKFFEKNILFSLAKIAELEDHHVDMIDYLNEILSKFSNSDDYYNYHYVVQKYEDTTGNKFNMSFYLYSYLKQVRGTSGLDFTFNLYRFNNYNVIDAHQLLAKVYFKIGAYELAIAHGLVAAVGILTRMYDYVSYYEPLYEFKNLRAFARKINEYTDIKTSFESTDFWEIVYNIAYATYIYDNGKHRLRAVDTWKLIVDLAPKFSPYVLKSKIQIKNFLIGRSVH
ncbi:Tetratricopeptide repeat family protein [Borrelia hermsii YBT]|nr:Tetratricopeptide repeat family protein [Borrelia hermsii YBT]